MVLLIPVDEKNYEEAKISLLKDNKAWIVVEMNTGFIKKYSFFDDWFKIDKLINYVIVKNRDEDIEEFLDKDIDILVAPLQFYVKDVVEAYIFRELHEI